MFSKPTNKPTSTAPVKTEMTTTPDQTPAARKAGAKIASVIANDITIEGNIVGEGELHVDGVVRGDIRVLRLSIGETGHVEGSITAEVLENRGRVVGSIAGKQVRLMGSCFVDGDITHEQLTMETGAFFQGRSLKFQRQAAPAAPATPGPQVKTGPGGEVVGIGSTNAVAS
jgi:cytoskeletal protein CcmA (bactofilin family)